MRLLVTRPDADARHTAAALRRRGHVAVVAPLLRIEAVAGAPIGAGPWGAILVTSANAAHAIAAHERRAALYRLPVFAVGRRSADAMREAGFADVVAAGGGVDALVRLVTARAAPGLSLLYLAGAQRSGDLAGALGPHGFAVHVAVVYRAVAAAALPPEAAAALAEGVDGVLHFSPRSAEAYVTSAAAAGCLEAALGPTHYCLSAQVAEPLRRAGAARVRVAPSLSEAALIELVG